MGFLPGFSSPGSLPTGVKQCRTPPRPAANAASCWGHGRLGPFWRILDTSGRAQPGRSCQAGDIPSPLAGIWEGKEKHTGCFLFICTQNHRS